MLSHFHIFGSPPTAQKNGTKSDNGEEYSVNSSMQQLLFANLPAIPTTRTISTPKRLTPLIMPSTSVNFVLPPLQAGANSCGASRRRLSSIRCMANPRRVKMVAKQIRRELSDMLLTDKVLQYAVLPEAALGADRYLSSLTTISDVHVSADLQVVKVYVSVFGDERGKEVAISGLKSRAKYVRSELGRRMKLRLTPEIRFIEDDSIERGSRVISILDRIKDENEKRLAKRQTGNQDESSDQSDDEDTWEGDDPNEEGVIYVK